MNAQIVLYNNDEHSDPQAVDMSVVVTMGGLRIVFLNWFISNVLVHTRIYNITSFSTSSFLRNFWIISKVLKRPSLKLLKRLPSQPNKTFRMPTKMQPKSASKLI